MAVKESDPRTRALVALMSDARGWQRFLDTLAEAPDTALNTAVRAEWGLEHGKGPAYEVLSSDEIARPWRADDGSKAQGRVREGEEPIFHLARRDRDGRIRSRPYYLPEQAEGLREDRYRGHPTKASTSRENAEIVESAQAMPNVARALRELGEETPDDTRLDTLRSEAVLYCFARRFGLPLDDPPAPPRRDDLSIEALVTWCNGLASTFREVASNMDRCITNARQRRKAVERAEERAAERERPDRADPAPRPEPGTSHGDKLREWAMRAGAEHRLAGAEPKVDRKAELESAQARTAAGALAAATRARTKPNGQQGRGR